MIEPINDEGNARHVFQYAENFLSDEEKFRKYALYEKHLVFDCDAPEDIQDVVTNMADSNNDYVLDYSSLVFETGWLCILSTGM